LLASGVGKLDLIYVNANGHLTGGSFNRPREAVAAIQMKYKSMNKIIAALLVLG
jgi:hypothetical protein